jgi:hypothetical protein
LWIPLKEGFGGERRRPKDRMTSQKSIIMSIKVKAKFCQGVVSNTKTEFEKFFTCRRRASNGSLPALEIPIRPWRAIRDLFGVLLNKETYPFVYLELDILILVHRFTTEHK